MTLLFTPVQSQFMHMHICTYLGLNAKVSVANSAANNAAYGRAFVYVTLNGGLRLKRDGICAETRFGLSAKWTSPFKSAGASAQSTAGSRGVRISCSSAW
jgi:hypothetical protein